MSDGGTKSGGRRASSITFTESQGEAVEYYASGEGMWINQYFRQNGEGFGELSQFEKDFVNDLDGALDKKVKDDVLYRSVDASVIFGDNVDFYNLQNALIYGETDRYSMKALNDAKSVIGTTKTEKGYMSTTRDFNLAESFGDFTGSENPVVMKISTSKNTKGADISKATKNLANIERTDPQKETLLARNQKYTVNKVYAKNGTIYVDVTMM